MKTIRASTGQWKGRGVESKCVGFKNGPRWGVFRKGFAVCHTQKVMACIIRDLSPHEED